MKTYEAILTLDGVEHKVDVLSRASLDDYPETLEILTFEVHSDREAKRLTKAVSGKKVKLHYKGDKTALNATVLFKKLAWTMICIVVEIEDPLTPRLEKPK